MFAHFERMEIVAVRIVSSCLSVEGKIRFVDESKALN